MKGPRYSAALALLALAAPYAAADNGALLASQCYQCHGPNGRSKGEIDTIAGKSASDIYGDMREMQQKPDVDIMHAQARIYTDAELRAIANYLATIR